VPKHGYAAGLASSSPLFPSCLPRTTKCYAALFFMSSVPSIQKLRKKTTHWRSWWVRVVATNGNSEWIPAGCEGRSAPRRSRPTSFGSPENPSRSPAVAAHNVRRTARSACRRQVDQPSGLAFFLVAFCLAKITSSTGSHWDISWSAVAWVAAAAAAIVSLWTLLYSGRRR